MATFYIDPTRTTGPWSGTFQAPFSTWSQVTWTAGNFYLQKAGTVFTGSSAATAATGAYGRLITLGSYDGATGLQVTSGSNRAAITNSSVVNITGVGSGRAWIVYDSLEIYGSGPSSGSSENAIGLQTAGLGEIIIRNCKVHDVPGVGIYVQPGLNNYPTYYIQGNEVYSTGSHGIQWTGSGSSWVISSNVVHDTGIKAGSFGITCSPHRYTGNASTWVQEAGDVYKCVLATSQSAENPLLYIESVYFSGGNAWNLAETTGAANVSSPAVGFYGFDAASATLYVNIAADPGTTTPSISYGRMRGWSITANHVYDTNNFATEGNAIQVDDNGAYGTLNRNTVNGSVQHGICYNKGHDLIAEANFVAVTIGNGLRAGNGRDNAFYNNTVSSAANSSCIFIDASNAGGKNQVINNICLGGSYGVELRVPGGTTFAHHNCIFGYSVNSTTGAVEASTNQLIDPNLSVQYAPLTQLIRLGGLDLGGGADLYGNAINTPPTMGAVQFPYPPNTLATPQLITDQTIGLGRTWATARRK